MRRRPPLPDPRDPVDLSAIANPSVRTVGMLARACLEARRRGESLRFTAATDDLRALLDLCGLADLIAAEGPTDPSSGVREGEQP